MFKQFFAVGLCLFMVSMLSGCGGSGGVLGTAPTISNLSYSPQTVARNFGGGATVVAGQIAFFDPDSDIQTLKILSVSTGVSINSAANISGSSSGILTFGVAVSTTTAGSYPFQISVKDSRGDFSNVLTGTFTVTP